MAHKTAPATFLFKALQSVSVTAVGKDIVEVMYTSVTTLKVKHLLFIIYWLLFFNVSSTILYPPDLLGCLDFINMSYEDKKAESI